MAIRSYFEHYALNDSANHKSRCRLATRKCRAVNPTTDQGFSVIYVLIATLILIAGTATLLNQSTSSMLGSIFQGQSQQARHAARNGMAYLISQINKEENRHLLVLPQSAETINPDAATSLWSDTQAATSHLNPCTKTYVNGAKAYQASPNLSGLNLGTSRVNNGYFYIADNGAISKTRDGATRAFRIINRPNSIDFKIPAKSGSSFSLLDETKNVGKFRLSVEAVVYRNGQSNEIASSTILQEDFSVVPKCCKIPFGSHQDSVSNSLKGHGNSNYALISRSNLTGKSSRCLLLQGLDPEGFGIIVVSNERNGGSILAGSSTILNSSKLAAVNPVYCVTAKSTQCTAADKPSGNQMERLDIKLPELPTYPGSFNGTPEVLRPCTTTPCAPPLSQETSISPSLSTPRTIFDATSSGPLPDNCTLHKNDIHCIYSGIDLSGSPDDLIFVSGNSSRRIRLYFPSNGTGIKQTLASGTIRHCKNKLCTQFVGNITDLSLFGSDAQDPNNQDANDQKFIIKAPASDAGFFIYAPKATVKIIGGSATFQSVIWANRLDITGTNAKLNIPRNGVADVFILMGILPDASNTFNNSLAGHSYTDLLPWDVVARSSNLYRFFGN